MWEKKFSWSEYREMNKFFKDDSKIEDLDVDETEKPLEKTDEVEWKTQDMTKDILDTTQESKDNK